MPNTPMATMPNSSKKCAAPTVDYECEGRDTNDILVISAILLNFTIAAYKMQFQNGWSVRGFETMFSDINKTGLYDRKGVRYDRDIGSWIVGGHRCLSGALVMHIREVYWISRCCVIWSSVVACGAFFYWYADLTIVHGSMRLISAFEFVCLIISVSYTTQNVVGVNSTSTKVTGEVGRTLRFLVGITWSYLYFRRGIAICSMRLCWDKELCMCRLKRSCRVLVFEDVWQGWDRNRTVFYRSQL